MKRLMPLIIVLAAAGACSRGPSAGTAVTPATGAPVGTSGSSDYRDVTLPAGTILPVDLQTAVGSDISHAEEPVHATLRRAVLLDGAEVLPAGMAVTGHVVEARRPGRVKGRGLIALRFNELDTPGDGTTRIQTATISHEAPATKGKDAIEILGPAAAAGVVGRLVGGKAAAREGALIGGAAGTGYVLSTRGKDVRVGRGAPLSVKLTSPVTVRVRNP
jgi:hypothetical protein